MSRVEGTEVRFEMNLSGLEKKKPVSVHFWVCMLAVYSPKFRKLVEMSFKNESFFAKSGQIWIWLKTTVYLRTVLWTPKVNCR